MTKEEKNIIRDFACGGMSLRDKAIKIYLSHLKEQKDRKSPEMIFMSEICNSCPDLILRAKYRKMLTEAEKPKSPPKKDRDKKRRPS